MHQILYKMSITCALCLVLCQSGEAVADGTVIDKVYHPYVQPLERELELRSSIERNSTDDAAETQIYRLGYGQSLNDYWFAEGYLIGQQQHDNSLRLQAFELEAQWQLTEQGEYWADWGMLFELEKARSQDIMEFSTALLIEKEWGRWTGTANLHAIYEFGEDINNEFETALAAQLRYRYQQFLEPALELYKGQNTFGLGPVITGTVRLTDRRQLYWEAGAILGLDSDTADQTFRLLLEYEF
jgi:hypothetical protein